MPSTEQPLPRYLSPRKKTAQPDHRTPFACRLGHTLRIFCQAHNVLQVVLGGGSHNKALVTNLERATKLLHITPVLLQLSDGCYIRQGRFNEYTRGELVGLIDWLVVLVGTSPQNAREDIPEACRIGASEVVHERGGTTKATGVLISPPVAPRHWQRYAPSTPQRTPQQLQQVKHGRNYVQELQQLASRSNSRR